MVVPCTFLTTSGTTPSLEMEEYLKESGSWFHVVPPLIWVLFVLQAGWFYNRLIPMINISINHFIQNKTYVHYCMSHLVQTTFLEDRSLFTLRYCELWCYWISICVFVFICNFTVFCLLVDQSARLEVQLFQFVSFFFFGIISLYISLLLVGFTHTALPLQFIHALLAAIRYTKRTFVKVSCFIYAADVVYPLFFILNPFSLLTTLLRVWANTERFLCLLLLFLFDKTGPVD